MRVAVLEMRLRSTYPGISCTGCANVPEDGGGQRYHAVSHNLISNNFIALFIVSAHPS